jgi:aminoglycoside phosphotransferase (APT) family kinase protein
MGHRRQTGLAARIRTVENAETTRLAGALAASGVNQDRVAECRGLAGGTYNAVYLVCLDDGTRLVVKIAPDRGLPALSYEQGILGTEALYYRLAARCPGVTVPDVVAADEAAGHLVMTECPGSPWPALTPPPDGEERDELRAELGRQVAGAHTITGTEFGYPSLAVGPMRDSWREAFGDMVDAVLADSVRFGVTFPLPTAEVAGLFAEHSTVLDAVATPVLVHFDLWDGNVLVDSGPSGRRIGGLIDAERAFWGDPLAEFVSLALFGDIERDPAFLRGYRSAGGTVTFDAAARQRLALYRAYLYLIMWVEAVPRGYGPERQQWLREKVLRPLTATLTDWSASS